jgi:hypothetical protein
MFWAQPGTPNCRRLMNSHHERRAPHGEGAVMACAARTVAAPRPRDGLQLGPQQSKARNLASAAWRFLVRRLFSPRLTCFRTNARRRRCRLSHRSCELQSDQWTCHVLSQTFCRPHRPCIQLPRRAARIPLAELRGFRNSRQYDPLCVLVWRVFRFVTSWHR